MRPPVSRQESGLPRFDFTGALAHELMHVWLFSNAPTDIDPAFREGSCNYAAYLALQKYSDKEALFVIDRMLQDPDPIYGDGFRRVKEFVEEKGIRYWLHYLQNHKYLSR